MATDVGPADPATSTAASNNKQDRLQRPHPRLQENGRGESIHRKGANTPEVSNTPELSNAPEVSQYTGSWSIHRKLVNTPEVGQYTGSWSIDRR